MHINSVVSTCGAQYITLDVKIFYLNTPMVRYKYLQIKIDDVPDKIIVEYTCSPRSKSLSLNIE
jgi:hypothetical protein